MGTKTISLDREAYDRLSARKREGESFSEVVNRIAGERPLLDLVGTGRPEDGVEEAVEGVRESLDRSTAAVADELDSGE